MKVYALPESVPELVVSYINFDYNKYVEQEKAHKELVKQELIARGFTGKHTGRIFRAAVADGYAQYMFADAGAKSCLIHLPYMDGYQYPAVSGLSKKWILEEMDRTDRLDAMFA